MKDAQLTKVYHRNPYLRFWKDFLFKTLKQGQFTPKVRRAISGNSALPAYIWARYAAVSCLRGEEINLDPTGGKALKTVMR